MSKFVPCRLCRDKNGPQKGYYYAKSIRDNRDVIVECPCHIRWRENTELERKYRDSGVNTPYTFDNYRGEESQKALDYLRMYGENFSEFRFSTMPYIYGPNGTQKTSMAKCLGQLLIQQGYTVKFLNMQTLMENLVDTFGNDEDKKLVVDTCMKVDLLILDECFDPTKVQMFKSGFQLPYLDSFLRNRFEGLGKSIMFISNIRPEEIAEKGYEKSLQSFIVRNAQNSTFTFTDVYFNSNMKPNPYGLFEGKNLIPKESRERVVRRVVKTEVTNG